MKKLVYVAVLLMFFLGWQAFPDMRLTQIYKNIDEMSGKLTPQSYKVRVENSKFEEALLELPDDILTGEGKPYVSIHFRKGEGVRIVIENVLSEYASLFSYIEDYVKFSGISKVQNPAEFKEIIDKGKVDFYSEEKDSLIVRAWDPEKEEKDDNYALFYLDKKNWVIKRAVYYVDGTAFIEAENSYKKFGQYYLPFKIVLTSLNDNSQDIFNLKEYVFCD
ncbi:MAG: hypothetical protein AMS17_04410 [Spirochaetes bacterium DG_61]|nr:MAG: hypothetical protein AMS17_04410 [Spirochaetes bacterium DG_61]